MEEQNMSLGEKLKKLRDHSGASQAEVGEYLNVSRQAVQSYEAATREPNRQALLRFSELYNIPLSILMNDNIPLVENVGEDPVYGRRKNDDKRVLALLHELTPMQYREAVNILMQMARQTVKDQKGTDSKPPENQPDRRLGDNKNGNK